MVNKAFIFIAFVIAGVGCQSASTQRKPDTTAAQPAQSAQGGIIITNPELYKQDSLQRHLDDEGGGTYSYTEKDLNVALPVIAEILKAKGYQAPAQADFQKRLQEVFAENFSAGGKCRLKEHAQFSLLYEGPVVEAEYPLMTEDLAVSVTNGFITHIPLISGLGAFVDKDHFEISTQSAQTLVSLNKFLFNDSKADLDTLLQQHDNILPALVISYGYTKEPKLNDLVMKEFLTGDDDHVAHVAGIIFRRDCNKQLLIREGLLNWVKEHTTKEEHRMLDALYNFAFKLYENNSEYTLDEKRKIAAYIDNIFIPLHDKYGGPGWPATELIFNLEARDPKIQDYIKEQHYFNLPELKNLYGE